MAVRDKVFAEGWPFNPKWSSNSTRKPMLFDWTNDINQATVDTKVYIDGGIPKGVSDSGKKIAWILESPAISEAQGVVNWLKKNVQLAAAVYDAILVSDRSLCELHEKIVYSPAGSNLPWITQEKYGIHQKTKLCSMFASPKVFCEGHKIRHEYASKFQDKIDLFGGAHGSPRLGENVIHPDKSEGIIPYMFNIAMENCRVPFYYTEKLTDCFSTGTVPVYWGSDCVGEIFDTDGIIILDENFDIASLTPELYQEMMPAIKNNYEIVKELESADDTLYKNFIKES